mgnify:CR=1 FL=1
MRSTFFFLLICWQSLLFGQKHDYFFNDNPSYEACLSLMDNDPEAAIKCCDKYYKETNDLTFVYFQALALMNMNDKTKGVELSYLLVQQCAVNKDYSLLGAVVHGLGNYYRTIGNIKRSHFCFNKVVKIGRFLNNDRLYTFAKLGLASVHYIRGEVGIAEKMYEESILWMDTNALNNTEERHAALANLSRIQLFHSGKYQEAKKGYQEAYRYFLSINNIYQATICVQGLGVSYYFLGEIDSAIYHIKEGLLLLDQNETYDLKHTIYANLGELYFEQGNYERAALYKDSAYVVYQDYVESINVNKIAQIELDYTNQMHALEVANAKLQLMREETRSTSLKRFVVILLLLFALIVMLIAAYILFVKRKEERLKSQFFMLESRALRAQINPHFLFNSLNSIQKMFFEGDRLIANEYMLNFSTLIRATLDKSFENNSTISEEFNLIDDYCSLENLHLNFMLYSSIEEGLEDYVIPGMIIQPFVENAIQHGISGMERGERSIYLRAYRYSNTVILEIEDNGHGLRTHSDKKENMSKGISITKNRLKLFGRIFNKNVEVKITDKKSGNYNSSGVIVSIVIKDKV